MSTSKTSQGFTIPELIIAMVVMAIMSTILFVTLDGLFYDNTRTLGSTTQVNDTRTVLRQMQSNLSLANNFLTTTSIPDPTGPPGGGVWTYTGPAPGLDENRRVLIASSYATTAHTSDANRSLVYVSDTSGVCDTDNPSNNPILENNYIYFVSNQTLYRRTVVLDGTGAVKYCGAGPYQKQTCTPGATNAKCKATDAALLRNVTSFKVEYFANPSSTTPIPNIFTTPALLDETVSTVVVTITTSQKINGKSNDYTGTIRISKAHG